MTLEGNIVQVPNATMYKETLRNFTTSPNRREAFVVGVGYEDAIDRVQEIALAVLADHPAVLQEPEPLVLADNLGKATVDMKVYFWLNGNEHNALKVRSSVIRLVKRAFQKNGISMPDEAREVFFPQNVPVVLVERKRQLALLPLCQMLHRQSSPATPFRLGLKLTSRATPRRCKPRHEVVAPRSPARTF
jgi:small-conductance mechanosensitive channel